MGAPWLTSRFAFGSGLQIHNTWTIKFHTLHCYIKEGIDFKQV